MSYYDFDEHFWSPKTVCIQSKSGDSSRKPSYKNLINIVPIILMPVCTGLLITILFRVSNSHLDKNFINRNNFDVNCLMLKNNSGFQIHCSKLD